MMYEPARLFVSASPDRLGRVLLWQAVFGLVGLVPLLLVYRRGLVRVSAQGG